MRSDNGPEFNAKAVRRWLESHAIATLDIEPGSPWENAYCESFNSRFRDGLLNREEFASELEAKVLSAEWRRNYNERRPHSALGDLGLVNLIILENEFIKCLHLYLMRNNVLLIAVALIGILGVIAVKQRITIGSLRRELIELRTASDAKPLANESISATGVPRINESASAGLESPAELVNTSPPISAATSSAVMNRADADVRAALDAQVQQLQVELEQTKRLIPAEEDANVAYVGPGMWVNADFQTRETTKLVIGGKARPPGQVSDMTIKTWSRSHPADYESPEVPFYLLDRFDGPRLYRRGFAIWDYPSGSRTYLLVTFERSGLRIDKVRFRVGESITPYSVVERMTRMP